MSGVAIISTTTTIFLCENLPDNFNVLIVFGMISHLCGKMINHDERYRIIRSSKQSWPKQSLSATVENKHKFVYCFHINGTNHTYFHFNHSSAINIVQLTFGVLTIKISVIVEYIGKRECIWEFHEYERWYCT